MMSEPLLAGRGLLRTLSLLRWIAAAGQLAAVLTVHYGLGYHVAIVPCLSVISTLVILNLLTPAYKRGRRIETADAAIFLGCDIVQLTAMLCITGGLANPFVILILGPITVAAGLLPRRLTALLTVLAILCLSLLSLPVNALPWSGDAPVLPGVYIFGIWAALAVACCFIAGYHWLVVDDTRRVADALSATQMALAREQRRSALGALAAAAAHELGSPLGTIAIIARELSRDVMPGSAIADDIALLQSQSDRCRDILTELARKPEPSSAPFDRVPITLVIEDIAQPYRVANIDFTVMADPDNKGAAPIVRRSPELVHGLGNILQNAMQFARGEVFATVGWTAETIVLTIRDDGPGFPPGLLGRLGEPYISARAEKEEHLGLGVFIALTLLERTGATLQFSNAERGGAQVGCAWQRKALERYTGE